MNPFKYLKSIWPTVRTWLVKYVLKRFLPKIISGPFGWVVTIFGEKVFDRFVRPGWNFVLRKANSAYQKWKRKPKAKKLEEAKNESDFDDSFDNMP